MVVRRMDSLARLVHSRTDDMKSGARTSAVVTAVAFVAGSRPGQLKLAVAHNAEDARQHADDKARLRIIRDAVIGNASVTDTAHGLLSTCGLRSGRIPDGQLGHLDRLIRDLAKLRAAYEGKYDSRPRGIEFKNALHGLFGTAREPHEPEIESHTIRGRRGAVHAEAALIAHEVKGDIGTSKLACGDCFDYADKKGRATSLRGTHDQRFPGWQNPDTEQVFKRRAVTGKSQYPEDSDSDVE